MFINFNNQQEYTKKKYTLHAVKSVLESLETKNKAKIDKLTEGLEDIVVLEDVLDLFSDKLGAIRSFSLFEDEAKPGPDPYHRGLDDDDKENKEEQMKDQAKMDDDDPDAYKEMPGDKEAREKGEVKTSKHTKAYADLYGEDLDEGVMSDIDLMVKKHKSFDSFEKEFFKEYGHKKVMKRTPEFLEWLKALYNDFDYMSGEAVEEAMGINDPVLIAFRAARTKREQEMANPKAKRKPLYGKQREKAQDKLWDISQELNDLYSDRGQLLNDMEQEAEPEGGPIANKYGSELESIESKIEKLITKRRSLEMKLAESFEVNEATKGSVKKVTNALAKNYKGEGLNFIAKVYQDAMEDANFHRELDTARGIGAPSKWRKDVYDIASSLSKTAGWNGYLIAQGVLAFLKELGEDKAVDKFQRYLSVYDLLESKMPIAEAVDTETVIQIQLEDGIYYIKPYGDSTHFQMSTMKDGIENAIPAHIGQHKHRPYYADLRKFLKGGPSIDGNVYESTIVEEGSSSDEIKKALSALKSFSKIRNVSLSVAAMDLRRALDQIEIDIEKGKIKEAVDVETIEEGKNDYMASYGKTNITIKKGYKVADENQLEDLYTRLGELATELGFDVKAITLVAEGQEIIVNEDEQLDEMTYGQLERCVDYAKMIRDRFDEGYTFDSWMHSKVNCAKEDLNSVFDALDGGDGEIEEAKLTWENLIERLNLGDTINENLKKDIKKFVKDNKKELDDLADAENWDEIYNMAFNNFNADPNSEEAREIKTIINLVY